MGLSNSLKKMLMSSSFVTEQSRIKLFGKMDWTLHPSRGLAQLIQLPAEEVKKRFGEDPEKWLFKFGHENGELTVNEIFECVGTEDKRTTQKTINDLLEFIGMGQLEFIKSEIGEDGHHDIVIHMINNPMIEHAAKLYGKKSHVCAFFRGLFSAYGEVLLGIKNAKLRERKCMCKGEAESYCEWVSKW
ncbi:MAG: hypothetical protein V3U72_01055 [Candidatus Aenigmarchaeota archaeon]